MVGSPGTDISNNRVAHYQSPGLGCSLSRMPLSVRTPPRLFNFTKFNLDHLQTMLEKCYGFRINRQ